MKNIIRKLRNLIKEGQEDNLVLCAAKYGCTIRHQPIGWTCYNGNGEDISVINSNGEEYYLATKITDFNTYEVSYVF